MDSAPTVTACTNSTSFLMSNEEQDISSSSLQSSSLFASPFGSLHLSSATGAMNGWQQNYSQLYPDSSVARPYFYSDQDRDIPGHISCPSTRGASGLLDTRQWSPLMDTVSCAMSGTRFPFTFAMESRASLYGSSAPDETRARRTVPGSQVIPDLSPVFPSLPQDHHAALGTGITIPHPSPRYQGFFTHQLDQSFPASNSAPSSSSGSAEHVTNLACNRQQDPFMIYRPPGQNSAGRRCCHRASAVYIEGLWIDSDDLSIGAGRPSGMISVHECRWAMSSNPCRMWIIGSRSRVGAHIRKWHKQRHTDSTVRCLWDGCNVSKAMLKDSINRHIVTVHLGEGFHCQGCNQEFSRKDVYNEHVESGEVCKDAGAAIVYGTERRVIDARQALQYGGYAVHYAG